MRLSPSAVVRYFRSFQEKSIKEQFPPLSTEQVLREEARRIHGADLSAKSGRELYGALNGLKSAALCLSGGGIRSASFALGVIQALASHPRSNSAEPVASPERSLLTQIHYLSTVSGGGYTGSWLSAWCARVPFATVWANLVGRPEGPDFEPPAIAWLRSYSNYLTPRLGVMSADSWALLSIYLRNLMLNWVVILPVLSTLVLFHQFVVFVLIEISQNNHSLIVQIPFGVAGVLFLLASLSFTTRSRPSRLGVDTSLRQSSERQADQETFMLGSLLWSLCAAIALTQFFCSDQIGDLFESHDSNGKILQNAITGLLQPRYPMIVIVAIVTLLSVLVYALGWLLGRPAKRELRDFALWSFSGLVFGIISGFGFWLYLLIPDSLPNPNESLPIAFLMTPVFYLVVGVPWILFAQWAGEIAFVGLISYQQDFDADQEWFGRAGGWLIVIAIAWCAAMLLTFAGFTSPKCAVCGDLPAHNPVTDVFKDMEYLVLPILVAAGFVTAVAGGGNLSGVHIETKGVWTVVRDFVLAIAASLFFGALIFGLSIALDWLVLKQMLFDEDAMDHWWRTMALLLMGIGLSTLIGYGASRCININRFSLHALYRNRLIRAYLGASRLRTPNPFSGFDPGDNLPLRAVWESPDGDARRFAGENWRPFHVINITLNIVSSMRLSWQERKAAPFIATPLHCGTSIKIEPPTPAEAATTRPVGAFRPSSTYGGGISLGTAMAISGAAASPNMGYHSSPAITFLMTLLNVRLGWWLGNPGSEGATTYADEGPKTAIVPLVAETLGLTTENRKYVYLSDGGHFDNLGLYEMIRRRCRFVLISDAGRDPNYTFEDLGNSIRKIAIDLGVSIRFPSLNKLKRRPIDGSDLGRDHDYYAIGDIDYESADGVRNGENGKILYVKAGYHGVESPGVRSYATANPDFPHQGTANQWFTESQLESYRSLGFEVMDGILTAALADDGYASKGSLDALLEVLASRDTALATQRGKDLASAAAAADQSLAG